MQEKQRQSKRIEVTEGFAYPGRDGNNNEVYLAANVGDILLMTPAQLRGAEGKYKLSDAPTAKKTTEKTENKA